MSKEIAISVNALSKNYKLYPTRRSRIIELIHPFRRNFHQEFHALKDISFTVKRGEVLGIIGQNGSGKSTLLKILASVVTPTHGLFNCNGKVTALLELGGGFDMELSGIENVFYLGAIQGYPKKEMNNRIKRILEFADIGEYAYQPVKTYSSGMYMRLSFALSINIDPDIIITDEALGVGDIRFQQKCYRKIREFKDRDKTIVLCSHSLSAVKDFCSQAIWLHEGKIREQGDPIYVTDCYNAFMTSNTAIDTQIETPDNEGPLISFGGNKALAAIYGEIKWQDLSSCESFGIGGCHIQFASIIDIELNKNISLLQGGEKVRVLLYLTTKQTLVTPAIHLLLNGQFGSTLFNINSHAYHQPVEFEIDKPSIVAIDFIFPKIGNGRYSFSFGVISIHESTEQHHHWVHDAMIIEVYNPDVKYRMGTALIIDEATVVSHTV